MLIIILEPQNVERMKRADPVTIERYGPALVNPAVMVCYEEPGGELSRLVHGGDVGAIIKHLTRGFEFRPDLGDHDRGPEPLRQRN
jgi:hypothetical protein